MEARKAKVTDSIIGTKIGTRLDDLIAEREARDPSFRDAGVSFGPAFAVANAVTLARIERAMTQAELARLLGTTNTAVSRLESGRHLPTLDTIQKLSDALDLSISLQVEPGQAVETLVGGVARSTGRLSRRKTHHLVVAQDPVSGAWFIQGTQRVVGSQPTQAKAIEIARQRLREHGGVLETRRASGEVREVREVRPYPAAMPARATELA